MADWDFQHWFRAFLIWAGIFALGGGIIAQTSEGASWQGFVAGMWKGIEWYLIIIIVSAALFFAWLGAMKVASGLNSN
jgi:hypothetical protein